MPRLIHCVFNTFRSITVFDVIVWFYYNAIEASMCDAWYFWKSKRAVLNRKSHLVLCPSPGRDRRHAKPWNGYRNAGWWRGEESLLHSICKRPSHPGSRRNRITRCRSRSRTESDREKERRPRAARSSRRSAARSRKRRIDKRRGPATWWLRQKEAIRRTSSSTVIERESRIRLTLNQCLMSLHQTFQPMRTWRRSGPVATKNVSLLINLDSETSANYTPLKFVREAVSIDGITKRKHNLWDRV